MRGSDDDAKSDKDDGEKKLSYEDLPEEVRAKIIDELPTESLLNLRQTNMAARREMSMNPPTNESGEVHKAFHKRPEIERKYIRSLDEHELYKLFAEDKIIHPRNIYLALTILADKKVNYIMDEVPLERVMPHGAVRLKSESGETDFIAVVTRLCLHKTPDETLLIVCMKIIKCRNEEDIGAERKWYFQLMSNVGAMIGSLSESVYLEPRRTWKEVVGSWNRETIDRIRQTSQDSFSFQYLREILPFF